MLALISVLDEMATRIVVKKLKKAGCKLGRQKGSHATFKCPVDKQTVVPMHGGGKDIAKGTLKSISRQSGVKL